MLNAKRLQSLSLFDDYFQKTSIHMRRTIYANFHEHISSHIIMIFACNCIWMYGTRTTDIMYCVCFSSNKNIYIDMRIKKPNRYLYKFSNNAVHTTRAAIFHARYIDIFTLRSPYFAHMKFIRDVQNFICMLKIQPPNIKIY